VENKTTLGDGRDVAWNFPTEEKGIYPPLTPPRRGSGNNCPLVFLLRSARNTRKLTSYPPEN